MQRIIICSALFLTNVCSYAVQKTKIPTDLQAQYSRILKGLQQSEQLQEIEYIPENLDQTILAPVTQEAALLDENFEKIKKTLKNSERQLNLIKQHLQLPEKQRVHSRDVIDVARDIIAQLTLLGAVDEIKILQKYFPEIGEKIPTANELKDFFYDADIGTMSWFRYWLGMPYARSTVFKLIKKYGKNIINLHNPLDELYECLYESSAGQTILIIAASTPFSWTDRDFEALLRVSGIDINMTAVYRGYQQSYGPLLKAIIKHDLNKVVLLLKYGAAVNFPYGVTPLRQAIISAGIHDRASHASSNAEIVRVLLQAGACLNNQEPTFSALMERTTPKVREVIEEHFKMLEQNAKKHTQVTQNCMEDIVRGSTANADINDIIAEYAKLTPEEAQVAYCEEKKDRHASDLKKAKELNRRIREIKAARKAT